MLTYRIEIQGNTNGEVWYNVSFCSGEGNRVELRKFNSADVEKIYSTVEKLADALQDLPNSSE